MDSIKYFKTLFLFPIFFAAIASFSLLHAETAEDDEIYVTLDTETPLLPTFLAKIETDECPFAKEYLRSLENVLRFDLQYNGATRVLSEQEVEKLSSLKQQNSFDTQPDFEKLKDDDVLYLVKLKIQNKDLIAKIISVNGQEARTIDQISLSGDLAKDRVKIHQLADAIHSLLFQAPGIASCKILFTNKKTVPAANGQSRKIVAEVYESDYDGSNVRQITHENTFSANPIYIPAKKGSKSTAFCYVSYKIGQPKIYIALLKDGTSKRLTSLKGNQLTPSISSDGTSIAFACDITATSDLFLLPFQKEIQTAGKPRHLFHAKGSASASPVFSPDGTKIAFVSDKDGSAKVYVMDIPKEGTNLKDLRPQLISKRCRENSAPAWSPDGKKLAYSAKNAGVRQIWIYDFDSKRERELTSGKAVKENPTWAPDSLHLLFNAREGNVTELYLINLNQPEAVKITQGPGDKQFPSWEPLF